MDELISLIKKAKYDVDSLETLIKQFKPMILKAAKLHCYNNDLFTDAVSEGTIALINCIKKYPIDSKIPFPYYAKMYVYAYIKSFTSSEMYRCEKLISLDEKVKWSENITIEDTLSSEDTLEDEFFKKYTTLKILKIIESLDPIEKEVMQRHYFLGHSLKKISEDTGYSYRGIRYVKTRGIKLLKMKLEELD